MKSIFFCEFDFKRKYRWQIPMAKAAGIDFK